jgi:hypothetical protein
VRLIARNVVARSAHLWSWSLQWIPCRPPSHTRVLGRRAHGWPLQLGGSVAGLLAARVLPDSYGRVTVVERDLQPAAAGHRRGVPQGRHVHALRPRGRELIEELFEG